MHIDHCMRGGRPAIRLYGITESGNSVLCYVTDFLPYIYIHTPDGFQPHHDAQLMKWLEDKSKSLVNVVNDGQFVYDETIYESNIDFELRFMIDIKILGVNWIKLKKGTYEEKYQHSSRCQYVVETSYETLISHDFSDQWSRTAPVTILSFDIECTAQPGKFPVAQLDPVIQIACVILVHGETEPCANIVLVLGGCTGIPSYTVRSYNTEEELLWAWYDLFIYVDPDVIIGYNIESFDILYLVDRAKFLFGNNSLSKSGRNKDEYTKIEDNLTTNKAYGFRDTKRILMHGRAVFDIYRVIEREFKLPSYKLDHVSDHFLGEKKEDVKYSDILKLYDGTNDDRQRLAQYCLKDALLPLHLMSKLSLLINYIELARVTGVPFVYLLACGQQIRGLSQICRTAFRDGYLVEAIDYQEGSTVKPYEGATVLDACVGYYTVPIATLDFSSLYLSIMMAHNLCYTTQITPKRAKEMGFAKDIDYIETPNGYLFVSQMVRRGLIPTILSELISARKCIKAAIKNEADPEKYKILEGRQLALKLSANSLYGMTGATKRYLLCVSIASSITSYGREMIQTIKEVVEKKYPESKVIYGDTDSVMINFGDIPLEDALRIGREAAEYTTGFFKKLINLEFEKMYFPYLLTSKKRYAGLYYTNTQKYDKLDVKGIQIVRRDSCNFIRDLLK
ncbi:DNA polymerase family B-domain-containing protein [Jimgerdemannia flammicorona]|uniref:DNA polymerase n=1 Tax=Jimgerdemannia flammicorona TaxID=994334 RepID=A0A433DG87_9FUNG|nr:DNA polymerase family B-domain-containing protein [Jimgerdemannia flammicorona]